MSSEPGRPLARTFPAVAESVPALRHAVLMLARALKADAATCDAVAIAVTEAATNVVLHAYLEQLEPGHLHVRAAERDGNLVVRVSDEGRGLQPRHASPGLGVGLPLIAQLAERFEVRERRPHGLEIVMRFPLTASQSA